MDYIIVDTSSETPIYRQIIESVKNAIADGTLKKGDKIPSLNEVKDYFNLSRDTVLTAFKELKECKIISATPGKGYYISTNNAYQKEKVFLLFDELNAFKEDLYNSFLAEINGKAVVEIFFHHFNRGELERIISEQSGKFSSYVILPGSVPNLAPILKRLPADRTYLLDRLIPELRYIYSCIYQDFESDLYNALNQAVMMLMNYTRLIFVSGTDKEPAERANGFIRFCNENKFEHDIIRDLSHCVPKESEAYLIADDRHLVQFIKLSQKYKLKIGRNIGIISMNDTMLKEVVSGGITTISTDFTLMGKNLARMIMSRKREVTANKSNLIIRNSL